MWYTKLTLACLSLVTFASASFEKNLAFRSPYTNDKRLEINTDAIFKRAVRKRQVAGSPSQIAKPRSGDQGYAKAPGEVDHSNADFIYAGSLNFTHGVASGDPYANSIVLWTRSVPTNAFAVDVPACLSYNVFTANDTASSVVSSGTVYTAVDIDWTSKVEATNLMPSTTYYYQFANFANPGEKSLVGRTRTAPGVNDTVTSQRIAVYSCSNHPNGFFSAYGGPVAFDDVDYVMHVGDYIYEYGTGGTAINRTPQPPNELWSLSDYRIRYGQYRSDPDLAASHQHFPWITVWDDHETANNDWKGGSQDSNDTTAGCGPGGICWTERAANAKRAYFEWIPIRQVDMTDRFRIYRNFQLGNLLDIVALDTRKQNRDITDLSGTNGTPNVDYIKMLAAQPNSSRSITGADQREWFLNQLDASVSRGAKWRLIANQVIFGTVNYSSTNANPASSGAFTVNVDSWDGYQADRDRILQHLYDNNITNTFAVTGDTHANWLIEVNRDTSILGNKSNTRIPAVRRNITQFIRGQLVEFGGTAVSSNGWGSSQSLENATITAGKMVEDAAGLLYAEGLYRGYISVEVSPSNVTTSYYSYPANQQRRDTNRTLAARFVMTDGTNSIQRPLPKPVFGAIKQGN